MKQNEAEVEQKSDLRILFEYRQIACERIPSIGGAFIGRLLACDSNLFETLFETLFEILFENLCKKFTTKIFLPLLYC